LLIGRAVHCACGVRHSGGQIEIGIGGGVESMSMVPMMGYKFSPNPQFAQDLPHYYTNMGLTAENVAAEVWHHPRTAG
jgi:acetyl-CoA acyltransferase